MIHVPSERRIECVEHMLLLMLTFHNTYRNMIGRIKFFFIICFYMLTSIIIQVCYTHNVLAPVSSGLFQMSVLLCNCLRILNKTLFLIHRGRLFCLLLSMYREYLILVHDLQSFHPCVFHQTLKKFHKWIVQKTYAQ